MGNDMNEQEFKDRTKRFGIRVIELLEQHHRSYVSDTLGRQLLRSATSVGANYRAACRAKSVADVIAKLGIVEEEADETRYWLEVFGETNLAPNTVLDPLIAEADEILAMIVASIKTLRKRPVDRRLSVFVESKNQHPKSGDVGVVFQSKIQNPKSKTS